MFGRARAELRKRRNSPADTRATRNRAVSPAPDSVIVTLLIAAIESKTSFCVRQSRKFAVATPLRRPPGGFSNTSTIRSGLAYGSGRRSTPSTKLKIELVAPIPSARTAMAVRLYAGDRQSDRTASRRSCCIVSLR
jgi:hypothetical protein